MITTGKITEIYDFDPSNDTETTHVSSSIQVWKALHNRFSSRSMDTLYGILSITWSE